MTYHEKKMRRAPISLYQPQHICHITRKFFWKDYVHLSKDGRFVFASNMIHFLNDFIENSN